MNFLYALPPMYQKGREPRYEMVTNVVISGPYSLGLATQPIEFAIILKTTGEIVWARVMQKKYRDTAFPCWFEGCVF